MTVYDMPGQEYNLKLAQALKSIPEFKRPEWSEYVKSSPSKERPIDDPDFWYKRSASILKQVYKEGVLGTNRLRTRYGGKKNRGTRPEEYQRAGGKIIRTILQQAEKAGFLEKVEKITTTQKRKGRKLTAKGKTFMESIK